MNLTKTIDTMKKINAQNSKLMAGMDPNSPEMVSAPSADSERIHKYIPTEVERRNTLTKEALYKNFEAAANKLKLGEDSKKVGVGFINQLVDNRPDWLKVGYIESYLGATYKYLLDKYTHEASLEYANLNKIKGYDEAVETTITDNLMKSFDHDIDKLTPDKIRQNIADRVEKATTDFIDARNNATDQIKKIYNNVKDFVGKKDTTEKDAKTAQESAKLKVSRIKEDSVSIFEAMVSALVSAAMTNPELKTRYLSESGEVNMDKIIDDTAAIYTVMETANVLGLVKIDEAVIDGYINSLKK
jgi:hypothetical protein